MMMRNHDAKKNHDFVVNGLVLFCLLLVPSMSICTNQLGRYHICAVAVDLVVVVFVVERHCICYFHPISSLRFDS